MDKQLFLSFIQKYSLSSNINSVVWEYENNKMKTKMMSDDRTLVGEVIFNNFDSPSLDGYKLGIFNTTKLVKLLSAIGDDVSVSLEVVNEKPIAIKFSESASKIKAKSALADLAVIPTVPTIKHIPNEFEIEVELTDEFAESFIRSKNAISDAVTFSLTASSKDATIVFGQTDVNVDTITMNIPTQHVKKMNTLVFNAEMMKSILIANKGAKGTFKVSGEGLGIIEYTTDEYFCKYYLIATPA